MWCFRLYIEQDISNKKEIAFSELVVLAVNWAPAATNNELVKTVKEILYEQKAV